MGKFNNKVLFILLKVISLISAFLLTAFIRINLSYLFRINVKELSEYDSTAFKLGAFFIAIIIISSYAYLTQDIFRNISGDSKKLNLDDLKPYQKRQINTKPWLVGILVGIASLLIFSLIFSIRQRDWRICVYPTWIYVSMYFLVIPPIPEINYYIKLFLELFSGLISYLIVKQNKLSLKKII